MPQLLALKTIALACIFIIARSTTQIFSDDLMVSVFTKSGVVLHQASRDALLVGAELIPVLDAGRPRSELGCLGHNAQLLLSREPRKRRVPPAKPDEVSCLDCQTNRQHDDNRRGRSAADEPCDRLQRQQRTNQQEIERGKNEFLPAKRFLVVRGEIGAAITHSACEGTNRPKIIARFMLGHFWSALVNRPNGSSRGNNRRLSVSKGDGSMSKRDAAIFDEILLTMTQIPIGLFHFVQKFEPEALPRVQIFGQPASQQRCGDEKPRDCLLIPA